MDSTRYTFRVILPFPPSTNTYYRKWHNRMVISDSGRAFKAGVAALWRTLGLPKAAGRVLVGGHFTAPDRRRRDLDNFFGKALFDSLKGLAYDDDEQVYGFLPTAWVLGADGNKSVTKGGMLDLVIQWLPPALGRAKKKRAPK